VSTTLAHGLEAPLEATLLEATLLVHLNLNQAALEVAERRGVLARVYGPLLTWLERRPWLHLGIAASGHTLERAAALDPAWLERLAGLVALGRVEFVGCGDTVLVGPLVPAAVNRWNQVLGRETYQRLLGVAPRLALVNEASFSPGLIDAYLDAGYEGLLVAAARVFGAGVSAARVVLSPTGRALRLLTSTRELLHTPVAVPTLEPWLTCLSAEVARAAALGARPRVHLGLDELELLGRAPDPRTMEKVAEWLDELHARGLAFARLERATLAGPAGGVEPDPAPGAAQALAGWALAGSNAHVNARCQARAKELESVGGTARDWQLLCRAFGSDLRRGLSPARARRFLASLPPARGAANARTAFVEGPLRTRRVESTEKRLALGTDGVRAVLHLRRGLALESLAFVHTGSEPLLGTVAAPGSDFGHLRIAGATPSALDLAPVMAEIEEAPHCLCVRARIATAFGALVKEVRAYAQHLELRFGLSRWKQAPPGRLIAGGLALCLERFESELFLSAARGGPRERCLVPESQGSKELVLGATDGWLVLDDGRTGVEFTWWPEETTAVPVVTVHGAGEGRCVRVDFWLSEEAGARAPLADFRFSLRPYRNRR
jgi:hypothetical protein